MKKPHICIIGGSGFIGTRLSHRLISSGFEISILDKNESHAFPERTRVVDVRDNSALVQALPEGCVLINLAAEHRDDVQPRSLYDEVNVEGARNVCAAAVHRGVAQIIFTSSVAVYGFAPPGTSEGGAINPFNDYGRTKWEAEKIYREWQRDEPTRRSLVVVRPTVVFGEQNRGNVFNLFRQIARGRFAMIGSGRNRKSMAYVENVAAFIEHCIGRPGVSLFNYVDKPDMTMDELVGHVSTRLGRRRPLVKIPFPVGLMIGSVFDAAARLTGKRYAISAIRVRKFCAETVFDSAAPSTGFQCPVPLLDAIGRTVTHEFVHPVKGSHVFYTE